MLGLSQMLKIYGLDMIGAKYKDKEKAELTIPCILHINGGFVVVTELVGDKIKYYWNDNTVTKDVLEFCNIWTGYALLTNSSNYDKAVEPDYIKHKVREILSLSIRYIIAIAIAFVLSTRFYVSGATQVLSLAYDYILSTIAILLCILLMQKQLFKNNILGDKVCSFFHQVDCNNVLHGHYGRVGDITWSEIGMGYFLARLICLSYLPETYFSLSVIGWVSMFYFFWSIWIQSFILRKYCTLCILVQILVWIIGIMEIFAVANGEIYVCNTLKPFCMVGCIILFTIFGVHSLSKIVSYSTELREVKSRLRSFKSDRKIFEYKQKQETEIDDSNCKSDIVFGNENAAWQVTILSNPHCNPCARMHTIVERLLEGYSDSICIRYVFNSFSEDLEDSARFLIAVYFYLGKESAKTVYKKWYAKERYRSKEFINSFYFDTCTEQVLSEMQKHKKWKTQTGYSSTPTIIVNGYEIPKDYELEDIVFIT